MSTKLLSVRKLEVVYGRSVRAIQGVSLDVEEGTIVALVGLNGAGKTTTIRAVAGFLPTENVRITDGEITFGGRIVSNWQPHQASAAGVAVVPERNKVFEHLTVRENLELSQLSRRGGHLTGSGPTRKFSSSSRFSPRSATSMHSFYPAVRDRCSPSRPV